MTGPGLRIKTGVSCGGNPTSGDRHGCVRFRSPGCRGVAARQRPGAVRAGLLAPLDPSGATPRTRRGIPCCVAHFAHGRDGASLTLAILTEHHAMLRRRALPRCACPYPVQRSRHQVRAALAAPAGRSGRRWRQSRPPRRSRSRTSSCAASTSTCGGPRAWLPSTRLRRLTIVGSLESTQGDVSSHADRDELRQFMRQELARLCPASAGSTGNGAAQLPALPSVRR